MTKKKKVPIKKRKIIATPKEVQEAIKETLQKGLGEKMTVIKK